MSKIALLSCDDLSAFVVDDDLFLNAYKVKYPEDRIEFVSWSDKSINWPSYDLAVIRTTWDYIKRLPDFLKVLEHIQASGCKLVNSKKIVSWNSRKTYLADLERKGVKIIKSLYLDDLDKISFLKEIDKVDAQKIIIKPVVGAGSDSLRVLSKCDFPDLYNELIAAGSWFVQPFLDEVFEGELSFIYFAGRLSHSIRKTPKKGDFRVQEEFGGDIVRYEPSAEDLVFCDKVLQKVDEDLLYARIDVLRVEGELCLMELELIEPSLYFRTCKGSAEAFADAVKNIT